MEHKWLRADASQYPDPIVKNGVTLRGWQKVATTFLLHMRKKFKFALLGDEMGVGKVNSEILSWLMHRHWKHWQR